MTAPAVPRSKLLRKSRGSLLALAVLVLLVAGMGTFVSYVLWPTWPKAAAPLNAPAVPVTVAGVLFNVPPASIRAAVQRHPGAHERIDLVFLWPSLAPPAPGGETSATKTVANDEDAVPTYTNDRLFVTIAGLGAVIAPAARLRTIYPRYIETLAATHRPLPNRHAL